MCVLCVRAVGWEQHVTYDERKRVSPHIPQVQPQTILRKAVHLVPMEKDPWREKAQRTTYDHYKTTDPSLLKYPHTNTHPPTHISNTTTPPNPQLENPIYQTQEICYIKIYCTQIDYCQTWTCAHHEVTGKPASHSLTLLSAILRQVVHCKLKLEHAIEL